MTSMQCAFFCPSCPAGADLNVFLLPPGQAQGQRKGREVSWRHLRMAEAKETSVSVWRKGYVHRPRAGLLKPPPMPQIPEGPLLPVMRVVSARGGGQHAQLG